MTALRVAVLGAGFMGGTHARAYHALDGVEVAAIHAASATRAEPLAAELGVDWTDDLERILRDDSIDAVDVCLPTPHHRGMAEAAIRAGKHVLLEKPLALTLEDADAIVRAAEQTDRTVMVAQVLRFWPEYMELARIVTSGELGRPHFVSAVRRQALPAWMDGPPKVALTGGALHDMLIHDYDAANWILGEPREAYAHAQVHAGSGGRDQAQVMVTYDGASALFDGGWTMPESYPFTARFEVICENGAAEYLFRAGGRSFEVGEPVNTLTIYRNEGDPEVLEVAQSDPYVNECAYFVECARKGIPAERSTPASAMSAMRLSMAAAASTERGEAVKVSGG